MTGSNDSSETPVPSNTGSASQPSPAEGEAGGSAAMRPVDQAELGLREFEELTPELVQDEVERNDFVLRWAVVLIAFLFGCTLVAESSTLVHIRSGQYLATHGLLPPHNDPFGAVTGDRLWLNLAWGFDLLIAAVYAVAGGVGLTLFKAVFAVGVIALLIETRFRQAPSWWTAVCAALAVLACHPRFVAQPGLITLLGLSLTMLLVHRHRTGEAVSIWQWFAVFLVWSNLDGRAFFGLAILLAAAVGELLTRIGQSPSATGLENSSRDGRPANPTLLKAFVLAVVAVTIHPFHVWVLTAPWQLYGVDYVAFHEYISSTNPNGVVLSRPMFQAAYFRSIDLAGMTTLLLWGLSLGTIILRGYVADAALWLVAVLLGVFAIVDMPMSALICALLAATNGQAWYVQKFGVVYSTETADLVWPRAGRSFTVLAFVVMSLYSGSQVVRGMSRTTMGFGLDGNLTTTLASLQPVIDELPEKRSMNITPSLGDLLIWLGQRPFIDGRMALYHGTGDRNLLRRHLDFRKDILAIPGSPEAQTAGYRKLMDEFELNHVIVRLAGGRPDYDSLMLLILNNRHWQITSLKGAAAVFCLRNSPNSPPAKYFDEHVPLPRRMDFREPEPLKFTRTDWPRPPSFYERTFWPRRSITPDAVNLGQHHIRLAILPQLSLHDRIALAYKGARACQQGIAVNPQCIEGYIWLTQAYSLLAQRDSAATLNVQGQPLGLRYYQAVAAIEQAIVIDPDDELSRKTASMLYHGSGRIDLERKHLLALRRIVSRKNYGNEPERKYLDIAQIEEALGKLSEEYGQATGFLKTMLDQQKSPIEIVQMAIERGCMDMALEQLGDPRQWAPGKVQPLLVWLTLLLETGRTQEAFERADEITALVTHDPVPNWQVTVALAKFVAGDYETAAKLWTEAATNLEKSHFAMMLTAAVPRSRPNPGGTDWPLLSSRVAYELTDMIPDIVTPLEMAASIALIEQGAGGRAVPLLKKIRNDSREFGIRRLADYYLFHFGEPSEVIPALDDGIFPQPEVEPEPPAQRDPARRN